MKFTSFQLRIYAAAGLRSLALGFVSVYLGLDLASRGVGALSAGFVIGSGLLGNTLSAYAVARYGNRVKMKFFFLFFTLLMAVGGLGLAGNFPVWDLCMVSFLGMVNGMGKDRGGLRALDQVLLSHNAEKAERTAAFANYSVITDGGLALAALLAGAAAQASLRSFAYSGYALLLLASALVYALIPLPGRPSRMETPEEVSRESKLTVRKLALLFSLDSIGGGFLAASLLAYWFFARFHPGPEMIGAIFFAGRILNLLSNYGAVWISKRIGLVRTMVFTHLPSSLLLIAAAFSPYFWLAALLFLAREALVQMDVPTRESYVMAVVKPHERPYAAGVANMVRNLGWAASPPAGGAGMAALFPGFSLVAGSALKIIYDLLLYAQFRELEP